MKKAAKAIIAIVLSVIMLASLTVSAFADEEERLKVEVRDGKLIFTVIGDFGYNDWIGVYEADRAEGEYSTSYYWWYITGDYLEGGEYVFPDDFEEVRSVADDRLSKMLDEDGNIKPGKFKAIILASDGYEPVDDMEPVYFEIKDYQEAMARDQVTVDGVDKASFGGNPEVTTVEENLYPLIGKQIRFWGWYGNDKALDGYGIKVDGGEMQLADKYEAADIVGHVKGLFGKDEVFASRFEIFVDLTEGNHTAEIFAIVEGEEVPIWTVNYRCLEADPTQVPTAEPTAEPTAKPTDVPTEKPTDKPAITVNVTTAAPEKTGTGGANTGLIIGIIAGVAVVAAAVIAAVVVSKMKGKK